jgi:hypothetical protein
MSARIRAASSPGASINCSALTLVWSAFKFAAGSFLHEQRYEIAYSAGCEPGVLGADEGVDNQGRSGRKLVQQSSLDFR